jgi:hypothetical protein
MKSQQPKEAATAKSAGGQPAVSASIKQKGMVLSRGLDRSREAK